MSDETDHDPLVIMPEAQAELDKILAESPEAAEEMRVMFAGMRQAMTEWKAGRYNSFEDAMEAITGKRPEKIDDLEDEDD